LDGVVSWIYRDRRCDSSVGESSISVLADFGRRNAVDRCSLNSSAHVLPQTGTDADQRRVSGQFAEARVQKEVVRRGCLLWAARDHLGPDHATVSARTGSESIHVVDRVHAHDQGFPRARCG